MSKQNTQPSTGRVAKLREAARLKGWKRREYYATPDEHDELKSLLTKLRGGN
jgi:hypothetical protein